MSLLPVDCFWWTMTAEDFDTTDADGFYWLRCRWWWARIIIIHQSNVIEYIYRYIYVYRLLSCFYHARTMYWCSLLVVAVYRHHSFLCVFFIIIDCVETCCWFVVTITCWYNCGFIGLIIAEMCAYQLSVKQSSLMLRPTNSGVWLPYGFHFLLMPIWAA